jgi:TetR/AcrR family transcriptional repressor of nem operon
MRVTKAKAAENRAALVAAAFELIQQHGFDGAGVAEISAKAGLTQGAFYSQFPSKADLAAEACRKAHADNIARWEAQRGTTDDDVRGYLELYLSECHLQDAGAGCSMAAYAGEICRQEQPVQEGFAAGVERMIGLMEEALSRRLPPAEARSRAVLLIAGMSGSLTMARATYSTNPELAKEFLASALSGLHQFAMSPQSCAPSTTGKREADHVTVRKPETV